MYNDHRLFSSTRAKSIDFVIAVGQVIRTEEIGTVFIPLAGGTTIELHNVALVPDCDSNLISLGQLQENSITFHNNPTTITLMRGGKIVVHAKRGHNLFTLDSAMPGQATEVLVNLEESDDSKDDDSRADLTLVSTSKEV